MRSSFSLIKALCKSYGYKAISFIFFTFLFSSVVNSQNANFWCFGNYAGINFNAAPPAVFTSSHMNTSEGCASIGGSGSSPSFYSNGATLWNGQNQIVIPDLNGSINSTQSALIIHHPYATDQKTYVFTTDDMNGNNGLQYSVLVNGSVESKNNSLLNEATERLTIALHCNKKDFWIITHGWNSNAFYAYKLTANGLDTIPVISNAGSIHSGSLSNGEGYLKASLQGNYLAQAIMGSDIVEVFRFDNRNGVVYDPITIPNIPDAYGVEFEYSESFLYASSASGGIFQYNISSYYSSSILSSKSTILQSTQLVGALQIASDFRIYVSVDNKYYLGCITKPHKMGLACNYDPNYIYLLGKKTEAGLPPEIPRTIKMHVLATTPCIGDTTFFNIQYCQFFDIDSVKWNFGDDSTTTDTSTLLNPSYLYTYPGNFDVEIIIYLCGEVDTLLKDALVRTVPYLHLGGNLSICKNDTITLFGGEGPLFEWSTGSTDPFIDVHQVGTYWVKSSNICGDSHDTIVLENIWPLPEIDLQTDTTICEGDSILLSGTDSSYTYTWQHTTESYNYVAKNAGYYHLEAKNIYQCTIEDSFFLNVIYLPHVNLGADTTICTGKSLFLNAGFGYQYYWNNGNTAQQNEVSDSGLVFVEVYNQCGEDHDSIWVSIEDCEQRFFVPNSFTPDQDGINDVFRPVGLNLNWNTFELHIFNRFGEQIFYTTDINKGWDGTTAGTTEISQIGAYAWWIKVEDIYGNKINQVGMVTLIK